jgi:hypothetical protein
MVGTAFTPDPGYPDNTAPVYLSQDSGFTWALNSIVPSNGAGGTADITVVGVNDTTANRLYSGILAVPGNKFLKELTTPDFTSSTLMTTQSSRPKPDQPFVQAYRIPQGITFSDRVFVGNNDHSALPASATVDVSSDGGTTWNWVRIDKRSPTCPNRPSIRPAVGTDGVVYAAFFHCLTEGTNLGTFDVVVVRDDNWGTDGFNASVDPGDHLSGIRVVTNVTVPWDLGNALGNNRIGSTLSLAVDPTDSDIVYLGWADRVGDGDTQTLHVRSSTDGGFTWSSTDLLTVPNATNLALAVGKHHTVGALYQQLRSNGTSWTWVTTLVQTKNAFVSRQTTILSMSPASTPLPEDQPYIGDYLHLLAVGSEFRGVFSGNNTPNLANFPQGVSYQRQVNFSTTTLLNNGAPVAISIDPFFFRMPMLR